MVTASVCMELTRQSRPRWSRYAAVVPRATSRLAVLFEGLDGRQHGVVLLPGGHGGEAALARMLSGTCCLAALPGPVCGRRGPHVRARRPARDDHTLRLRRVVGRPGNGACCLTAPLGIAAGRSRRPPAESSPPLPCPGKGRRGLLRSAGGVPPANAVRRRQHAPVTRAPYPGEGEAYGRPLAGRRALNVDLFDHKPGLEALRGQQVPDSIAPKAASPP